MTFRIPSWPCLEGRLWASLGGVCAILMFIPIASFAQGQTTVIIRDGNVENPVLSPEGRFVVYESVGDLWRYDSESAQFEALVIRADEVIDNLDIADTRAKISLASDVVPIEGILSGFREIFIYRELTDSIELISAQADGTPSDDTSYRSVEPKITPDGRYVAFVSSADDLLPGESNPGSNIYLYDRVEDSLLLITRDRDGNSTGGTQDFFDISDDGSRIVFVSGEGNLVANDTNDSSDVFLYDGTNESIVRINEPNEDESDDANPSDNVAISGDGQTIVWFDSDRNLDPSKTSTFEYQVFLKNLKTGAIRMISRSIDGGEPNDGVGGFDPGLHISSDGRFVFFHHEATDLVVGDSSDDGNIYVYDRQTSELELISLDENDVPLGPTPENPGLPEVEEIFTISNDGRFVAYFTDDGPETLYLRDRGDVLAPAISALSIAPADPLPDDPVLLEATATDRPSDLSSPVASVEYNIDDMGWLPMDPVDGAFDTPLEQAFSDVGDQGVGLREYCVRATDSLNNISPVECITVGEDCSNGVDDDGDGKIDGDDENCADFGARVKVACLHDPIYPMTTGEDVSITANVIDDDGNPIVADVIEIWVNDQNSPASSRTNLQSHSYSTPANGETLTYGCYASLDSGGLSPRDHFSGWRTVDVGDPEPFPLPAIPVLYHGPVKEKLDIVFFPDRDEYLGPTDPLFLQDVHDLINDGLWTIPWFVEFQKYFNFWIAEVSANTGPDPDDDDATDGILCLREEPDLSQLPGYDGLSYRYAFAFADSGGIVHRSVCRDNAGSPGLFTISIDRDRMQVLAHEMGHRPFGLADEYCCDGGYFTDSIFGKPPYPNLFQTESGCQNAAADRGFPQTDCRELFAAGPNWWIFEPDFDIEDAPLLETPDLMQQTGNVACPANTDDGCDSYQVGPSESDRMSWVLSNCFGGEC